MSLQKIRTELERLRGEVDNTEEKYEIIVWHVDDDGMYRSGWEEGPTGRLTGDEVAAYIQEKKERGIFVWSIEVETIDVGSIGDENGA